MPRPVQPEERDEIENLAVECEDPDRLRACLLELIRMRSFVKVARQYRGNLRPPAVRRAFEANVPVKSAEEEYVLMLAGGGQVTLELEP